MSAQNVGPVRGAREVTTLFSLDVEIERGGTRWDGRTSHETKFSSANGDREDYFLLDPADHEQDWQLCQFAAQCAERDDHTSTCMVNIMIWMSSTTQFQEL